METIQILVVLGLIALFVWQKNYTDDLEERIAKLEHPFLADDDNNLWEG